MTHAHLRAPTLSLAVLGTVLTLGCGLDGARLRAEEPPLLPPPVPSVSPYPPLPAGVIARVYRPDGTLAGELTRETLARVLAMRVTPDLMSEGSSAFTNLRLLIEEVFLDQEGRRLGLSVTPEEVTTKEGELDSELRIKSGGLENLAQRRKTAGMTLEGMRMKLRVEILKEKIAGHPQHLGVLPKDPQKRQSQISVVVIELHKKATIVYGLRTAWSPDPATLGPGVVALVNGEAVSRERFGAMLFQFLDETDLRDAVNEECTAKLLETEGVTLSDAEMEAELALRARVWEQQRDLFSQEIWREKKVGYEEFLKASLKKTRDEVKADRFYRSFYGLVRRERAKITDKMVEDEFEKKRETHYGKAVLVHEFHVSFESPNALIGGNVRRTKREAMQLVSSVKRQIEGGRPFSNVVEDVVAQHADPRTKFPDPTVSEGKRRLFNVSADQLLFVKASQLRDGQMSDVIETLSELHLLLRVREEPAKVFAEVREAVREHLAGLEAQYFMRGDTRIPHEQRKVENRGLQNDPRRVQVRIPIRGE
jgi:hypothetical protein